MTTSRISQHAGFATLCISLIFASHAAFAQEWIVPPTEEHEILKQEVGVWDATVKVWPAPDAEPMVSKGVEKNHMLKGDLWLITEFEGEVIGTPFIGKGTFGYDPAEKKYTGVWVDTMTPHMMITKSDYDPKTKTLTGIAETRDVMSGEKYNAKMITRFVDDDTRVMEMHRKDKDGKESKVMEISYKRRANDEQKQ